MPKFDICSAVVNEALTLVVKQMPELTELFPFRNAYEARLMLEDEWLGLIVDFGNSPGIPAVGVPKEAERAYLLRASQVAITSNYDSLRTIMDASFFSFNRFSYVGPWKEGMLSWPHLSSHLLEWINEIVLPEVLRRNQARVLLAVPRPPQFNFMEISKALWILECEESCQQGTAFS